MEPSVVKDVKVFLKDLYVNSLVINVEALKCVK